MKKLAAWMIVGMLAVAPVALAEANCPYGGGEGKCHRGASGCPNSGGEQGQCPIVAKFMKKADFFLSNKQEIGFSDEQVGQIKALQVDMQKAMIRQEAEMKIAMLEMTEKLSAPDLDTDGLNAMIDQGMAGMAEGAKASVAAYAKLKAIPTAEQLAKAKEIWQRDSK